MSPVYINHFPVSVTTGIPQSQTRPENTSEQAGASFREMLEGKLAQGSEVSFSKHAANRVLERNIELSENSLSRLNEGMKIAQRKGLNDTLILVDKTAFIVNVKSNKVITTVNGEDLKGNAFTNIDGTVII